MYDKLCNATDVSELSKYREIVSFNPTLGSR